MVTKSSRYRRSNFTKFVLYPMGALVFLLIFSIVIILANGYRFKFDGKRVLIEKTGIIILSSRPNDTKIYLGNKDTGKKTSFSFLTTRINDLLPGKYTVTLKKEGYRDWQKQAEIKPNLVTWLNYALLFPLDLKLIPVENFNSVNIITQSKNKRNFFSSKTTPSGQELYISDQSGLLTKVWPKEVPPVEEWLKNPEILSANFNLNNEKLLLNVKNGAVSDSAIMDAAPDGKIVSLSGLNLPFSKIIWSQSDSNLLFGLAGGSLYQINASNLNVIEIGKNIVDFSSEKNGLIYYVSENEEKYMTLNQMGGDGNRKELIAKAVTKDSSYKISYSSQLGAIALLPATEKTLTVYYKLNNQQSTVELAKGVTDFNWGVDGRKIYYYGDNFIKRFDWTRQEEAETKMSKIRKMDWYFDEYHFIVLTDDGLSIIDFDGLNKIDFSNKRVENFYLDPKLSSIVFAENDNGKINFFRYISTF